MLPSDAIALFKANPLHNFSLEEIMALKVYSENHSAAATPQLKALHKIIALNLHRANAHEVLIDYLTAHFTHTPTAETAGNIAMLHYGLDQFAEAYAFCTQNQQHFDPIAFHKIMNMITIRLGNLHAAQSHGEQALQLQHEAYRDQSPLNLPASPAPAQVTGKQNVIAFSLYGTQARYIRGALHNAIVARHLYPGWQLRFYIGADVPHSARAELTALGAELVEMATLLTHGKFWRFLVADDQQVHRFLIRDCDSVLNIQEAAAVQGWIESGKPFHIMRDHPQHTSLILAGMWGGISGIIPNLTGMIEQAIANETARYNNIAYDQEFLARHIWPAIHKHSCIHDSHYPLFGAIAYDQRFILPEGRHIGQNDAIFYD